MALAKNKQIAGFVGWLAVSLVATAIGGAASIRAGSFYSQQLARPEWAPPLFGWQQGALAFADIVLLWLLIVATLIAFWRISAFASALLIPCLLWVNFATALNYSVWQLNPQILG